MGLILPQEIEVTLCSANILWYEEKGYDIPRRYDKTRNRTTVPRGTKIFVNVLDLQCGSHVRVKIECDYCNTPYDTEYRVYLRNRERSNRTYCQKCALKHVQKETKHRVVKNHKWASREYALEQLDSFIKVNGTLKGMTVNNTEGARIRSGFRNNGYDIRELCEELGYDYLELCGKYYDDGYLDDYENFKHEVNKFIDHYGCFPTLKNFKYDLHIPINVVAKYGGVKNIQKDVMCDNNNLLEDDRGFYNSSHYEYMVAQFLIHNNVDYLREQFPFPKPYNMLRSDFTFFDSNKHKYHIEVWGYYQTDLSTRAIEYNKNKIHKEHLYEKYNMTLISIEPNTFNFPIPKIQDNLYAIFSPYINKKLMKIDIKYMVNPNKMSDSELLNRIMEYSDDDNYLPKNETLRERNPSLLNEMVRRYGGQNAFAIKHNKLTYSKVGMWDENFALNILRYMHDTYGFLLSKNAIRMQNDDMLIGFMNGIQKVFGSLVDGYLYFYNYCLENRVALHKNDVAYLQNIINGRYFNNKTATTERKQKAKDILEAHHRADCYKK